jgi:hypothetical protein
MVESLVLKQDQVEAFQVVFGTYRKHNSTSSIKILPSAIALDLEVVESSVV